MLYFIITLAFNFLYSQGWEIDTTSSFIKYTGNHTLHTWEGVSNNINFSIDCIDDNCKLYVSTPLEDLDSGNDSRDSNMLYYSESLLYPTVSFSSDYFTFTGEFDSSIDLEGTLDFHGIKNQIPITINLFKEKKSYWGSCEFNFSLDSFNVERPSLLMIKISDLINIKVKFHLIKIKE